MKEMPVTRPKPGGKIKTKGQERQRHQFNETIVADQVGELASQMLGNISAVVGLEVTIVGHVKVDDDRHDLAGGERRLATGFVPATQEMLWSVNRDGLAEIIDIDEKIQ